MVMMALFTDLTMRKATSFQQGFGIIGTKPAPKMFLDFEDVYKDEDTFKNYTWIYYMDKIFSNLHKIRSATHISIDMNL